MYINFLKCILNLVHTISNSIYSLNKNKNVNYFVKLFFLLNILFNNQINANSNSNKLTSTSSVYRLIGVNSYAQYPPWQACLNGTLKFEFKTIEPNGLLLYAQNLPYRYIQLSLTDGVLRIRFRISVNDDPRGILIAHVNRVNNDEWHFVQIKRYNERTIFTIDESTYFHTHKDTSIEGSDLFFGAATTDTTEHSNLLFVGGIPETIQTYDLSLSTALFEQTFNGFIRNVRVVNCTATMVAPNVLDSSGLRYTNNVNYCTANTCQNSGVCLNTDNGYMCDCSFTLYEGKHCEKIKPPQTMIELTFSGKEYISFDIPTDSKLATTYEEEFYFEFKTTRSTGLLAYAGDTADYFVCGLQDGGFFVKINLKGQEFEKLLTIPGVYLHNNDWHSVKILRKLKKIEIILDNMRKESDNLNGDFIAMYKTVIYIGGTPQQKTIYRTIRKNFIGCLRNITFKTDSTALNLIELASSGDKSIQKFGNIQQTCQTTIDPVTFNSPESYIPIYKWKDYPKLYSFTIEFQTNENHGVLAYILGSITATANKTTVARPKLTNHTTIADLEALDRDFFALEIHNRFLNAYVNYGKTYYRHEVVHEHVSGGRAHQLNVDFDERYVTFKFDQQPETTLKIDSYDGKLDLSGPLVIGGIHPSHLASKSLTNPSETIPPYFYSGMLNHGYVGCIQDVEINGQFVNLTYFANTENISGISMETCNSMPSQCEIDQCLNEGTCLEGWNRFICDCSATGFNGPICNQPAIIANFNSGQFVRLKYEPEWVTEAEHISFRFRTNKKQNSVLLSTYSDNFKDFLELALENRQIRLHLKMGNSNRILYASDGLVDNKWHTVKMTREGNRLIVQVDSDEPATDSIGFDIDLKNSLQLQFSYMDFGTRAFYENNAYFVNMTNHNILSYDSIDLGVKSSKLKQVQAKYTPFEGQMQQLTINGKSYFELINNDNLNDIVNKTVTFAIDDIPHKHPITFHNRDSWIKLPKIEAFHTLLIQFHFKTDEENGVIMYNDGENGDYLAFELLDGQISFSFNLGKGIYNLKSQVKDKMNDNKWHLVSLWRSTKTNHELTVDSLVYKHSVLDDKHVVLNLAGHLYVGGLMEAQLYEELRSNGKIHSSNGFQGCLASLEINKRVPDYDEVWSNDDLKHGSVAKGCETKTKCNSNVCKNNGVCVEKWEENDVQCNCDSTTYTGKYCDKKNREYIFKKNDVLVTFENAHVKNWDEDVLVFGIETQEYDAMILRSYSQDSNRNIIVEILDGYLHVSYNVDSNYFVNSFKAYAINDQKYHVIKFLRNHKNSTLHVDEQHNQIESTSDSSIPDKQPSGNAKVVIDIGGYLENPSDNDAEIKRQFKGKLFGLVYNGIRILDAASQQDYRSKTRGKLEFVNSDDLNQNVEDENIVLENFDLDDSNEMQLDDITLLPVMEQTTKLTSTTYSTLLVSSLNEIKYPGKRILTSDSLNIGVVIAIIFASILAFIIIVYAFYKYRNRDEGTYTIDETKNFGPFAELDISDETTTSTLCNGKKMKSKTKSTSAYQNGNKEWYV